MASLSPAARAAPALRSRLPRSAAASAALAIGATAIGVYFLLPPNAQSIFYVVIGLASVTSIYVGAVRNQEPGRRLAWYLFAVGLLTQVCGDAIFAFYEIHLNREPPSPGVADALYLSGYPLLVVGIFLVVQRLGRGVSRVAVLDTAVVFLGVALVQWVFFISRYNQAGIGSRWVRTVAMAYPAMDVLLLVGLAQLIVGRASRSTAYRLLLLSVALWIVADELYGLNPNAYVGGDWIDALWLGSYVTWAAAALHPSSVRIAVSDGHRIPRLTSPRLALLALALLTAPVILLAEQISGRGLHAYVLATGGGAIALIVLMRLAGLVQAVDGARASERLARRDAEHAQRLLAFQNEQLRELDQLKDEFVSSVSHELRTPLTSISGYAELLLEEEPSETKQGYLHVIERNSERLLALVSDILFAARLQDGRLKLDLTPVDLQTLIEHAVEEARPRAENAGVEIEVRIESAPTVSGEHGRLAQLLDNLVSNAIKFTPRGGKVAVDLRNDEGIARIEVSDTGIGIVPEDRDRLFERFFRSQAALEHEIQGTGLGLYISKAIVEAHGGRIGVSSTAQEGTTFIVELPAAT